MGKGKGKFRFRTGHEKPRGGLEVTSTLSLTSALDRGGWSTQRPGRFTPGNDPILTVQEARWAPGPVWTGVENLFLTGIRSLYRPARSNLPNRLSYPDPPYAMGRTTFPGGAEGGLGLALRWRLGRSSYRSQPCLHWHVTGRPYWEDAFSPFRNSCFFDRARLDELSLWDSCSWAQEVSSNVGWDSLWGFKILTKKYT
jgi:hypothetical protein